VRVTLRVRLFGCVGRPLLFGDSIPLCQRLGGVCVSPSGCASSGAIVSSLFSSLIRDS
jgi:hypothetical protein